MARFDVCIEPPICKDFGPEVVPANSVLVLNDFRTEPDDIRKQNYWEIIPTKSIKGKALLVWLSVEYDDLARDSGWFPHIRFERMFKKIY